MIESHTFIEVTAPHNSENFNNQTTIKRMQCNYCNGTGEILHINDNGDREFVECPCCHGTRFVDAVITVSFEPSKFILKESKIDKPPQPEQQQKSTICRRCGKQHPLVAEFGYCGKCAQEVYETH